MVVARRWCPFFKSNLTLILCLSRFYIVEYLFPLVSAGFEDVQHVPSEITKVVSSKVTEGGEYICFRELRETRSSVIIW